MDPQTFTDNVSTSFKKLASKLEINNTDFIRTTEDRHINSVKHLWNILVNKGDIYIDKYHMYT